MSDGDLADVASLFVELFALECVSMADWLAYILLYSFCLSLFKKNVNINKLEVFLLSIFKCLNYNEAAEGFLGSIKPQFIWFGTGLGCVI